MLLLPMTAVLEPRPRASEPMTMVFVSLFASARVSDPRNTPLLTAVRAAAALV
jgi:hypothetical protein